MSCPTSIAVITWLAVLSSLAVSTRTLVATHTKNGMMLDMFLTVSRTRRSEHLDFTEINRYVCPPSLCRQYDESTKSYKPRPRGTGGTIFFQGDIILDDKMSPYIYKDENKEGEEEAKVRTKRATMRPRRRLWKNALVKYRFGKDLSPRAKDAIVNAIEHLKNNTCLRFEEKGKGDEDFIRFISESGCWSQVGRVGGVQLVSLGRGCETLGTAVHEIVHALGVWHEQARPDRNRYVRVVENNISPKFLPDFEMVDRVISTNRGYTYDYNSLMHYSKYAFTRNGQPTIQVINKGSKLGLTIGQRKQLSTIDIAQIRDMYKCNQRTEVNETRCPKGWKKRGVLCYKFFPTTKAQFGPALAACVELKSHLLVIKDASEQRFLNKYLIRKFPNVLSWRTAGKVVKGKMAWFISEQDVRNMTYTNWARYNPRSHSSTILKRGKRDTAFKWHGEWLGSVSQRPYYQHPFICQRKAKRKCVQGRYADGRDYRGKLDYTRDGYTCQKWTERYPKNNPLRDAALKAAGSTSGSDSDGLGDHNYCRNPSGKRRSRPWCFITKKKATWGYCDVSTCMKSVERFKNMQAKKQSERNEQQKEAARYIISPKYSSRVRSLDKDNRRRERNKHSSRATSSFSQRRDRNRGQRLRQRARSRRTASTT